MKMQSRVLLAALFGALVAAPMHALGGQPVEPTETGESGLLTIPSTRTLAPRKVSLGFSYRTEIGTSKVFESSLGQSRDTSLDLYEFSIGVGLYRGLEVSLAFPYVSFDNQVKTTGDNVVDDVSHKVGDVRLTPKVRLFEEGQSPMPFSLALEGSIYFPTGSQQLPAQLDRTTPLNGDNFGGEVMAIVDKDLFDLPGGAPVTGTLNLGGLFPSKPNVFRLDRQTEPVFAQLRRKGFPNSGVKTAVVQYGAGLKLPLWVSRIGTLDSTAEYRGNTGTIEDADAYQAILTGFRYTLANGLAAHGGVDFGLSNSVQSYTLLVGISYSGPQPPPLPPAEPKEKIVYRDRVIQVETVEFSDVNFDFDKATLTDVGHGRVYLVAQKLKEGENVKIEIEGKTAYIGTEDYNKKLGMERAEAVKAELVTLGVNPASISTVSFGEERPLIDKKTPWARAVNRRVEFVVVTSGEAG